MDEFPFGSQKVSRCLHFKRYPDSSQARLRSGAANVSHAMNPESNMPPAYRMEGEMTSTAMVPEASTLPSTTAAHQPNAVDRAAESSRRSSSDYKIGVSANKGQNRKVRGLEGVQGRSMVTYILCSSRRIFIEKQHSTVRSVDRSSGLFRTHAVNRVSCAGSKAMVPNSSQYRTTEPSVRISWREILPWQASQHLAGRNRTTGDATYISQALDRHVDQLGHLLVPSYYFPGASPAARRHGHAGKHAVVLHQRRFEPHLDRHELQVGQGVHLFPERGPEFVQLSLDALLRGRGHSMAVQVGVQARVSINVAEGFQ